MRFIYAHDGTAVNVDHIVTIFIHQSGQPQGYVVRCATTFSGGEYVHQHAYINLSPVLTSKNAAEEFLSETVDLINTPLIRLVDEPDA